MTGMIRQYDGGNIDDIVTVTEATDLAISAIAPAMTSAQLPSASGRLRDYLFLFCPGPAHPGSNSFGHFIS